MTKMDSDGCLRIALLIKSLRQGGAQRQCCVLAAKLSEMGHVVSIVVFDNADIFDETILPKSVEVISLGSHRWNIPWLLWGLYSKIRIFRPHLLYGFMSQSNLLSLVLQPFIRTKVVCGIRASRIDPAKEPWSVRFGERIHELALRFADLIIANSHTAKARLVAIGLSADRIAVVANGIDTDRFRFDANARADIRRWLGYTESDHVVGMFARIHPMKGHEFLLSAFSLAVVDRPDLKLLLVGSGDRRTIEERISKFSLGSKVMVLDEAPDIERYYSAIDRYCSASLYGEGFSNSLAEAMAVGLPCIATDVGDSGLIVDCYAELLSPGDVYGMADAIRCHPEDTSETDAEARREYIVRNFGLNLLGQRTIQALRRTQEL